MKLIVKTDKPSYEYPFREALVIYAQRFLGLFWVIVANLILIGFILLLNRIPFFFSTLLLVGILLCALLYFRKYYQKRTRDIEIVQKQLQEKWSEQEPSVLQDYTRLFGDQADNNKIIERISTVGILESKQAIEWALRGNVDRSQRNSLLRFIHYLATNTSEKVRGIWPELRIDEGLYATVAERVHEEFWLAFQKTLPFVAIAKKQFSHEYMEIPETLHAQGLLYNAFETPYAEYERLPVSKFFIAPAWCNDIVNKLKQNLSLQSSLIVGPSGSGKTTLALYLTHHYFLGLRDYTLNPKNDTNISPQFPIYWQIDPDFAATSEYQSEFAQVLAQILIACIATEPELFYTYDQDQQAAIAYLLALHFGGGSALALSFYQFGLERTPYTNTFLDTLQGLTEGNLGPTSNQRLLQTISCICSSPSHPYIVLADVQTTDQQQESIEDFIKKLREFIIKLDSEGVIGIVFVPSELQINLDNWPVRPRLIKWQDEDIYRLLEQRTRIMGLQRFGSSDSTDINFDLVIPHDRRSVIGADVLDRMVSYSQKLPGRLIQIGYALMQRVLQTQKHLTQSDVDEVFASISHSNPKVKGTTNA